MWVLAAHGQLDAIKCGSNRTCLVKTVPMITLNHGLWIYRLHRNLTLWGYKLFGSNFIYFSRPWELIPTRAFQGTGKAIKSNMGEWLQDKCLVSTSQQQGKASQLFEGMGTEKNGRRKTQTKRRRERLRERERVWRDRQEVSYTPPSILGSDTVFDLWPHSSHHPIIAFLQQPSCLPWPKTM